MPNYANGKIYKLISNQTDDIYIGSTTQSLATRKSEHKSDYKRFLNGTKPYMTSYELVKYDNIEIILIDYCVCNNKDELRKKEQEFIDSLKCVNKHYAFGKKDQTENNRRLNRERYIRKREEILEKDRIYKMNNKEKISERTKVLMTCECGATFRKDGRNRHLKSIKHQERMKQFPFC